MRNDRTDSAGSRARLAAQACAAWIACALLVGSSPARAGSNPSGAPADPDTAALEATVARGASVADLTALAYRSNPMIRAARADWQGVVERYRVETAWADPEIMVEGMYAADTFGSTATPMDYTLALTQTIPLLGRQEKAGDVSRSEAKIAKLRLDAAVRDAVLQVRQSAHELAYLAEARAAARAQQELVGRLTAAGAAAYAGDRASLFDVMKARAQSGQLDYDVQLLEEAERVERARLNALLDRPADAPLGPVAVEPARPLVYGLAEIDALAESNAEDLRIARAELERAEAMARLTRYETLPGLKLGVSYGRENEVNQVGLQATMMLPLHGGKNAGRTGAAQADIERTRAMVAAKLNDVRAAVHDAALRLRNAERLVALYRDDLVPQSQRALETAQTRVSQGQGSLGDAAEAQSSWYAFRVAQARAAADRGTLLARLEALAGRRLTDRDAVPAAPPGGSR
jgi:outer membrane protein TolC